MESVVEIGGDTQTSGEVFTTSNGATSIVVLEETEEPERPNPPMKPRTKSTRDRRNQREVITQEMLPAEELSNFADLDQLANPDKLVVENKEEGGPPPSPPNSRKETPVPPKFPPAPPSGKTARRRDPPPAKGTAPREAPRRAPPPSGAPDHAWNSDFEVHEQEEEAEVFEYHPPGSRRGARRFFDDDDDNPKGPLGPRRDPHSPEPLRRPHHRRQEEEEEEIPKRRKGGRGVEHEDEEPKISPDELRKRRKEDEEREKMQLLYKLYQYEQRGYRMANSYSMESNIDELRFEVSKIRNEDSARHSVKWYKVFLMIVVSSVETLNTKFDPFGLRLKGWSRDMNAKKDDLDECFHRLHEKYSQKTAIEPELELAFAFFGGAFMYHLQNAADNFGELGNLVNAITGGPTNGETEKGPAVMTNMHFPPASVASNPSGSNGADGHGGPNGPNGSGHRGPPSGQRPKRRVMKPPDIPSGAAEIASMMPMMMEQEEEDHTDVPIDFHLPKSVGGARPQPADARPREATGPIGTARPESGRTREATKTPARPEGARPKPVKTPNRQRTVDI